MSADASDKLRYPIGTFNKPDQINSDHVVSWISKIISFPRDLRVLVENQSEEILRHSYRPNGWSIIQLVHHCGDSHMNSVIRFKLALTEDQPTIRPYDEAAWAEQPDANEVDLTNSLLLIDSLHYKWGMILNNLSTSDLERTYVHPEHGQVFNIKETIGSYAWHCEHHLAHIKVALYNSKKA